MRGDGINAGRLAAMQRLVISDQPLHDAAIAIAEDVLRLGGACGRRGVDAAVASKP